MSEKIQITMEVDRRNPRLCRFTSDRTLYIGTRTVKDSLKHWDCRWLRNY